VRPSRLLLACLVAAGVILSAPFIGQIRSALRSAFPGQWVTIVSAVVGTAAGGAILLALTRIRDRRARRYAAILAALGIGAGYAVLTRTGRPEVDAVERFHFVEYGLVTFLFYRAWRELGDGSIFLLPVLAGLTVGTLEEWFQWFVPVRVGEMKDIFLNGVAIACGLLVSYAIDPPPHITPRLVRSSVRRVCLVASAAVLVFAAFFHVVHLGYAIHDPTIGTFYSRYDTGQLRRLAVDRGERWKRIPPLKLVRVSREDQYMTEGVVHVQRRNEVWAEGNVAEAWAENLILEKYFAPVLDTPSFVSPSGHRWPHAQRADAAARIAALPSHHFVSQAYPYRLFLWPRAVYWTVVLMLAAALAAPAVLHRKSLRIETATS
jgi:hypothetical protein